MACRGRQGNVSEHTASSAITHVAEPSLRASGTYKGDVEVAQGKPGKDQIGDVVQELDVQEEFAGE